ncbi:protein of unknown function DUF4408 [Macleaya cordata]|uniref:Uncharacterized protein n=1 Tax=Macleaya cordata TaxID=56857 RepID=A0A200Q6W2_MACCD|nr:protein of unknown function DUF4408 [Macleaya cordata]
MDLFEIDNVKAEKANAMRRYRRLRKIANLFRFFEICLVLMFLSWFSTQLPTALRISGDYFQNLSVFIVSPKFVFLVGNAIILTLFAKSGKFPGQNSTSSGSGTDLYDEFIKNSESSQRIGTDVSLSLSTPEEVVFHDKQTVYEESSVMNTHTPDIATVTAATDKKIYRRTQSENLNHAISEKPTVRELRRSETEKCRKVENPRKKSEKVSGFEEEMSNDEFRRKIEEFIAKQMRFHREESMAIVLQNKS